MVISEREIGGFYLHGRKFARIESGLGIRFRFVSREVQLLHIQDHCSIAGEIVGHENRADHIVTIELHEPVECTSVDAHAMIFKMMANQIQIVNNDIDRADALRGANFAFTTARQAQPVFQPRDTCGSADGLGNGLGYGIVLIAVASIREILGFGKWLGMELPLGENFVGNGLVLLAPGAFIILGLLIWGQRTLTKYVED